MTPLSGQQAYDGATKQANRERERMGKRRFSDTEAAEKLQRAIHQGPWDPVQFLIEAD